MTTASKKVDPDTLIPMDLCAQYFPLQINLAYAHDQPPNIFGKVYHDDAKLWLHEDLAKIVCLTAQYCHDQTGYSLILYDGLRTKEAQEKMAQSPIVLANPQWMQEPRLLSPPGSGAHPRGMAIDMSLIDAQGSLADMGTDFDHLATDQGSDKNPAHREYKALDPTHAVNRDVLNDAVKQAAQDLGGTLDFLAQEWWDFRFQKQDYEVYDALSDNDLPGEMRMVNTVAILDFDKAYGPRVQKIIADISSLTQVSPSISSP